MGDSTTAELVGEAVDNVDEKEKSGDENGKKAEAEKKVAKEKTKSAEKKACNGLVKNQGGATPKNARNAFSSKK